MQGRLFKSEYIAVHKINFNNNSIKFQGEGEIKYGTVIP